VIEEKPASTNNSVTTETTRAPFPIKVAFVDNGFIQRRLQGETLKGGILLRALAKHFGGNDVAIAASPFLWVELAGVPKLAIDKMDKACKRLPAIICADDVQKWLEESLGTLFQDSDNIGQLVSERIATELPKTLEGFLPALRDRLTAMWNDGQKDCSYQRILVRHLAIDRLAVSLTRKHSEITRKNNVKVGGQVVQFVARFLKEHPGISPYRMLLLSWEPAYDQKKLERGVNHELKEKGDLLDGDLVTRSVLKLDNRFESPLILTADSKEEFQSRRNHFASACLYINEKIDELGLDGCVYKTLELTDSTVCYAENDGAFAFIKHNMPSS
jgi:hypothetical protein